MPLRTKKAGRFDELLCFARSHLIVALGSVSLSCVTTLPAFLNLNGNPFLFLKFEMTAIGVIQFSSSYGKFEFFHFKRKKFTSAFVLRSLRNF